MKITQVLIAQAIRFVSVDTQRVYLPAVVKTVRERYGFVGAPNSVDEVLAPLDPNNNRPLIFMHGMFAREGLPPVIIDKLECYRQLVVVDTATAGTTDAADLVLDDLLSFNPELLKQSMERRAYISTLEAVLDISLDLSVPLAGFGESIGKRLAGYLDAEAPEAPFEVSSVAFSTDPAIRVLPADFRVERRIKTPFASNLYFSQAPLRTADHQAILEELERRLPGKPPD